MTDRQFARLAMPSLGQRGLGVMLGGGQGGGVFGPSSLFANGEQGFWYDPSDLSSMSQDDAGAVPAAVDAVVGLIRDKSGRGNHASQSTAASKPILRSSGGLYYLEFDGTDDSLVTATFAWGTDKVTAVAGLRKSTDTLSQSVFHYNNNLVGSFFLQAPSTGGSPIIGWRSRGSTAVVPATSPTSFPAPITLVVTGVGDIAGDASTLRLNGVQQATAATDQGTGVYGPEGLSIGIRPGALFPFGGRLYGLIGRAALSDAATIISTEGWMNGKTGAY